MAKFLVVRDIPGGRDLMGMDYFNPIPKGTILSSEANSICIYNKAGMNICDIGSVWEETYLRRIYDGFTPQLGQAVRATKGRYGAVGLVAKIRIEQVPSFMNIPAKVIYTIAYRNKATGKVFSVDYTEDLLQVVDDPEQKPDASILDEHYAQYDEMIRKMIDAAYQDKEHWNERVPFCIGTVNNYKYIVEMDGDNSDIWRIPSRNLYIVVGDREERGRPHFHIFPDERHMRRWHGGASLMLNRDSYFLYGDNRRTFLQKEDFEALYKWLREYCLDEKTGKYMMNWDRIVRTWNKHHPYEAITVSFPQTYTDNPEIYEE